MSIKIPKLLYKIWKIIVISIKFLTLFKNISTRYWRGGSSEDVWVAWYKKRKEGWFGNFHPEF